MEKRYKGFLSGWENKGSSNFLNKSFWPLFFGSLRKKPCRPAHTPPPPKGSIQVPLQAQWENTFWSSEGPRGLASTSPKELSSTTHRSSCPAHRQRTVGKGAGSAPNVVTHPVPPTLAGKCATSVTRRRSRRSQKPSSSSQESGLPMSPSPRAVLSKHQPNLARVSVEYSAKIRAQRAISVP